MQQTPRNHPANAHERWISAFKVLRVRRRVTCPVSYVYGPLADHAKVSDTRVPTFHAEEAVLYCNSVNIVLWSNPLC
jgi:hypothetical protein